MFSKPQFEFCLAFDPALFKNKHIKSLQVFYNQKHRIIEAEKDLRWSVVQLPAQSKVSHEIRESYSGLYPICFGKPPRTEAAHYLWGACSSP